jgi:agmatinase
VETFDEETGVDLEQLSFALGPVIRPGGPDPADYVRRVQSGVRPIVQEGKLPFVLGGEHSVSIGAVRAVREVHPAAHFLAIDAHADLRDRYEGYDCSHACVARRVHEGGAVTVLGVRSYSAAEAEYAARAEDLTLVPARTALSAAFSASAFVGALGEEVYVSVDVDGLDPAVIADTGTPEPGGLTWMLTLDVLAEVARRRRIVGLDLVELAPTPAGRASAFAAARLAAKMITYALAG